MFRARVAGGYSFAVRSLFEIAAAGDVRSADARVHHVHSLAAGRVGLSPLVVGATFLTRWATREGPGVISWRADFYECMAPATFVIRDAVVHASSGVVVIGDDVVAETLAHTDPVAQGFAFDARGVVFRPGVQRCLAGTHITVLAGGTGNYFHSLIEGVARVGAVPAGLVAAAGSLLFSAGGVWQAEMLGRLGLPASLRLVAVGDGETVGVERLVFPLTVHGLSSFHPCVAEFFETIASHVSAGGAALPRRIYIDRRGSGARRLANEDAVVAGLEAMGFVAVRLEALGFAEQVRLFRGAECVVGPHGAGLTNIGFARAGCRLLELQMDAYVNWQFRHLAALRGVAYDCVLGRAREAWLDVELASVHGMGWEVDVGLVRAAVQHLVGG